MMYNEYINLFWLERDIMNEIYFDNAATTQVCDEAVQAAIQAMTATYGNPSSLHRMGLDAENTVNRARKILAGALGCQPGEITFTSGATESNNLAVFGAVKAYRRSGNKIVTTSVEHPSVAGPVAELEQQGFEVVRISPDATGHFQAQDFEDAVDENTLLVTLMHVNNETGMKLPIEQIAQRVKRKNPGVILHVDAVQSFCKISFKLSKTPVDLMSVSGHKIYAPKGIGALFVRKGVRVLPQVFGGGQERGLRSGTESVPLIAAFGASVDKFSTNISKNRLLYVRLNEHLRELLSEIPDVTVNSPEDGVEYILNFSVAGIRSEIMLHFLESRGIYVSSGSACSKGARSGVLGAMGLPAERIDTAIRVSFGYTNTDRQVRQFVQVLQEGINTLVKQK